MSTDLTLLCVTAGEPYAGRFLNEMDALANSLGAHFVQHDGRGAGIIENVLDDAVRSCPDGYILRLDDDERVSDDMRDWLFARSYRRNKHWAFPRLNLYPDERSFITTAPLWPDLQTRLSVKEMSGGRGRIHVGSPFGTGEVAPCAIEHWKFLVRSQAERQELAAKYADITPIAGSEHYRAFSLPEEIAKVDIEAYGAVPA